MFSMMLRAAMKAASDMTLDKKLLSMKWRKFGRKTRSRRMVSFLYLSGVGDVTNSLDQRDSFEELREDAAGS
jgi:hypothetical protein